MFNSTQDIYTGLIEEVDKKSGVKVKENRIKPDHTFMPVISTLAFKDTDIDWGQKLNDRNLVCTGEIPFDAYMVSGINQDHITITEDIFDFIKYQVLYGNTGCSQICGIYSIKGLRSICNSNTNTLHTYTFKGDLKSNETISWEVTGKLTVVNNNGNSIDVKITSTDGHGEVIAIIRNNCGDKLVIDYPVSIGNPDIQLSSEFNEDNCRFAVTMYSNPRGSIPVSYLWSENGVDYSPGPQTIEVDLNSWNNYSHDKEKTVYGKAEWGCGYSNEASTLLSYPQGFENCYILYVPTGLINKKADSEWIIYPNPSRHSWNITIPEAATGNYELIVTNMNKEVVQRKQFATAQRIVNIDNKNCAPGMYSIHIRNKRESIVLRALKLK